MKVHTLQRFHVILKTNLGTFDYFHKKCSFFLGHVLPQREASFRVQRDGQGKKSLHVFNHLIWQFVLSHFSPEGYAERLWV